MSLRAIPVVRRFVIATCCLTVGLLTFFAHPGLCAAESQPLTVRDVEPGWQAVVRLGRWNLATVKVDIDATRTLQLACRSVDADGHTAVFLGLPRELTPGTKSLSVPYQVGRPDRAIIFEIRENDQVVWSQTWRPGTGEQEWRPLVLSDRLIVTVGRPRGFDNLSQRTGVPGRMGTLVVEYDSAADLPQARIRYDSVDWLFLAGETVPSASTLDALRNWVGQGGRLCVSFPRKTAAWQSSPLKDWLPIGIADEPALARELGALESFAARNLRIPYTGSIEMPKLLNRDGTVLASSRDDALLLRTPWGLGEVWVLSLDLTSPPLASWGGLPDMIQKWVAFDHRDPVSGGGSGNNPAGVQESTVGQLTSSGISDLASQLQATQDQFASVNRPAPWWAMAWMLGLIAIVGPLDYLLVHQLLQRPRLTWITLPLWIGGATAYATMTGTAWNDHQIVVNQVDIVDIDAGAQQSRVKSWMTIYSPETGRLSGQVRPAEAEWQKLGDGAGPGDRLTGWFYIPETVTGGIYRPAGSEWGRTDYELLPTLGEFRDLPLLQWSSRTLMSEWARPTPPQPIVDSDLRNTGLGRLTGEITHHLPGPLTDWFLAYGGRAYRLQPSRDEEISLPLEAGRRLSTNDPLFVQTDLRGLLTRLVVTEEKEGVRVHERRIFREQGRYDALNRDPARLWEMLTFHRQSGGKSYTSLTNDWLQDDDFTRQLDLGRAVIFGRLEAPPAAELTIAGERITPQRADLFVRIVLPVRRSGEIQRTLPKFEDEPATKN